MSIDKRIFELVGKPYKEHCYDGKAFDCFTLVYYIFNLYGINIQKHNVSMSLRNINKEITKNTKNTKWKEIDFKDRKPLDILLFNTSGKLKTHIGLILDNKYFIHTTKSTNVVIDKFYKSIYLATLYKVYRWHSL